MGGTRTQEEGRGRPGRLGGGGGVGQDTEGRGRVTRPLLGKMKHPGGEGRDNGVRYRRDNGWGNGVIGEGSLD